MYRYIFISQVEVDKARRRFQRQEDLLLQLAQGKLDQYYFERDDQAEREILNILNEEKAV